MSTYKVGIVLNSQILVTFSTFRRQGKATPPKANHLASPDKLTSTFTKSSPVPRLLAPAQKREIFVIWFYVQLEH